MASFARRKITIDELAQRSLENEKALSRATKRAAEADEILVGLDAGVVKTLDPLDPAAVRSWLQAVDKRAEAKTLVATATSETAKFPSQYAEILTAIDDDAVKNPDDQLATLAKVQADEVMAELAALNDAAKDHPAK